MVGEMPESSSPEVVFGYKRLTTANWLQPDPVSARFVQYRGGRVEAPTADEWAEMFLRHELAAHVPEEVRSLFNVARGVMLYGFFFYPLYTLGQEQVFRVAEAATIHRCKQLDAPPIKGFVARVRWLRNRGILSEKEADWWDTVRRLRNYASHPEMQSVGPPGPVLGFLRRMVERVNALFEVTG